MYAIRSYYGSHEPMSTLVPTEFHLSLEMSTRRNAAALPGTAECFLETLKTLPEAPKSSADVDEAYPEKDGAIIPSKVRQLSNGYSATLPAEPIDPVVSAGSADRITSYNVCYTKLLRVCAH